MRQSSWQAITMSEECGEKKLVMYLEKWHIFLEYFLSSPLSFLGRKVI